MVLSSPLLLLGFEQRGQVAWIAINQSSSGLSTLLTLSGSALVTVVIGGIIAIALILGSEAAGPRRAAWRWQLTELSLPWMLVPPALLLGASAISPIYTSRYILMCVPAVALLGGMALVALGRIIGPVALVLVVLAGFTAQVAQRQPYGHYDNVRALDQIVAAHARPGDVVLYTNPNAESFGAAYGYGLRKLPNIATKQAANSVRHAGRYLGAAAGAQVKAQPREQGLGSRDQPLRVQPGRAVAQRRAAGPRDRRPAARVHQGLARARRLAAALHPRGGGPATRDRLHARALTQGR